MIHARRSLWRDESCTEGRDPGGGVWDAVPPRNEGPAEGDAAADRHPGDPVRRGGGRQRRARRHPDRDRSVEALHRRSLRPLDRARAHPRTGREDGGAGTGDLDRPARQPALRASTRGERSGPCHLLRRPSRRQRAVRGDARRRHHGRRLRRAEADARGLRAARVLGRRPQAVSEVADLVVRLRVDRRSVGRWPGPYHRPRREAAGG